MQISRYLNIVCLLFGLLWTLGLTAQDGTLDGTFGNGGVIVHDISGGAEAFGRIVLQPDGKLVTSGVRWDSLGYADAVIVRLMPDGSLDPTFAVNGVFNFPSPGQYDGLEARYLSDGSYLLFGSLPSGPMPRMALLKLSPDGWPDVTFGTNGVFIMSYQQTPWDNVLSDVVVLDDGSVMGVGRIDVNLVQEQAVLVKFLPNGVLDASFGLDGIAMIDSLEPAFPNKITRTGIDQFLVTGTDGGPRLFAAKCFADGSLDPSFGSGGVYRSPLSTGATRPVFLPNGDILTCGRLNGTRLILSAITPNGVLDTSFGVNGYAVAGDSTVGHLAYEIVLQPDGKIIASGKYQVNALAPVECLFARFLPNGSLDPTYASGGITHFSPIYDSVSGGIVQLPDGKAVAVVRHKYGFAPPSNDLVLVRLNGSAVGVEDGASAHEGSNRPYCSVAEGVIAVWSDDHLANDGTTVRILDALGRSVQGNTTLQGSTGECSPCYTSLPAGLAHGTYVLSVTDRTGARNTCVFVLE